MFPTCQGTACFSPEFPLSCKGWRSTCENAVLAIITIDGKYRVSQKKLLTESCWNPNILTKIEHSGGMDMTYFPNSLVKETTIKKTISKDGLFQVRLKKPRGTAN